MRAFVHCLRCELDAWAVATTLVPFSPPMWGRLHWSLSWYRASTPSDPETQRSVDALLVQAARRSGVSTLTPIRSRADCDRLLRLARAR